MEKAMLKYTVHYNLIDGCVWHSRAWFGCRRFWEFNFRAGQIYFVLQTAHQSPLL